MAVTANITIPKNATSGYVTLTPLLPATLAQLTSTVNFPINDERSNNLTVPLGPWGILEAYYGGAATTATTNIVVDITGYFTADATGASYVSLTPSRLVDTRSNLGTTGPVVSKALKSFQVVGRGGVGADAIAVSGNVTMVKQTQAGYVTVAPALTSGTLPKTETAAAPVGDIRANGIVTGLGSGKLTFMYVGPAVSPTPTTQLVFDVTGYFR